MRTFVKSKWNMLFSKAILYCDRQKKRANFNTKPTVIGTELELPKRVYFYVKIGEI